MKESKRFYLSVKNQEKIAKMLEILSKSPSWITATLAEKDRDLLRQGKLSRANMKDLLSQYNALDTK